MHFHLQFRGAFKKLIGKKRAKEDKLISFQRRQKNDQKQLEVQHDKPLSEKDCSINDQNSNSIIDKHQCQIYSNPLLSKNRVSQKDW